MKKLVTLVFAFLVLIQSNAAEPHPADLELEELVNRIKTKLNSSQPSEETLAAELEDFEALIEKYADVPEQAAQIAYFRASLYAHVLNDEETGKKQLSEIESKYPSTRAARQAEHALYLMSPEGKAEAKAKEDARLATLSQLTGSPAPELDFEWSTQDGLSKLSDLKGQVVVLDFWATWCGPCISSFPQMREHVTHFEGCPVTILGVTSLQGRISNLSSGKANTSGNPELEYELTSQFIEEHDMTWDVAFSKQKVFNEDYGIRGIPSAVIIAPDGTVRHVGLHPGNPQADITGKIETILKEFELPLPKE